MFLQAVEILVANSVSIPEPSPVDPAWHPGKYDSEPLCSRYAWRKFREAFGKFHFGEYIVLLDRIEQATPATGHESPRWLVEAALWHFTRLDAALQKRLVDEWHDCGMRRLSAEQSVREIFNVPLVWDDFDYAGRVEVRFDAAGNVSAVALSHRIERSMSIWSIDLERVLKAMRDKIDNDPTLSRSDSLFGRIDI